jgi:hypothetical protein
MGKPEKEIKEKPYEPRPTRPKLRVRLREDGPFVDLGISHSELLVGILDTLDFLSSRVHGGGVADSLRTALDNLEVHRGKGKGKGKNE